MRLSVRQRGERRTGPGGRRGPATGVRVMQLRWESPPNGCDARRHVMVSKRRAMLTLVALAVLVGGIGAQGPPARAQERPEPMPRPDLALTVEDLPPGYQEGNPIDVRFSGAPIQDRSLRPTVPGLAPTWIWTATFQVGVPVTEERIARWGDDLVTALSLDFGPSLDRSVGAPVLFANWADPDPIGL